MEGQTRVKSGFVDGGVMHPKGKNAAEGGAASLPLRPFLPIWSQQPCQ